MKNKFLFTTVVFILFIGLFSCEKDPSIPESTEPVMPPLTHQGLNTFGCYIDGELFVANDGWSVWSLPPLSGSYDEVDKQLNLQGTRHIDEETDEKDNVKITADITDFVGVYEYRYHEDGTTNGYQHWGGVGGCSYTYQNIPGLNIGKLSITYLDEAKNIISGTFYMNLINTNCEGDTILKITDGRFDFHY